MLSLVPQDGDSSSLAYSDEDSLPPLEAAEDAHQLISFLEVIFFVTETNFIGRSVAGV